MKNTKTGRVLKLVTGALFFGSVAMGILVHPLWMLASLVFLPLTWNFRYGPELALEGWRLEDAGLAVGGKSGATGRECYQHAGLESCKAA
ncbi:MAG: hypothetical protein WCX65_13030 [bacterium]